MRLTKGLPGLLLLSASLLCANTASALDVWQMDTFEDGTTQGWFAGLGFFGPHPAPPVNVPTGGPAGADDNYLLATAIGGQGLGSRLTIMNDAQWAGDYIAKGIKLITMDVLNLGSTDLDLRLLFENPLFGPPTDLAFSTNPVHLPVGSGWTSVSFPVDPASLTALSGDVTTALSTTTILRLYHSPSATFPGPPIVTQLGVDNIQAVPEPGSLMLLLGGGVACSILHRRRRRHP